MMYKHTHAHVSPSSPEAFGECQRCGFIYKLSDLKYQFEYRGKELVNTQLKVCPKCMDIPAPFLRAIVLPPDPPPVIEARPRLNVYVDEE